MNLSLFIYLELYGACRYMILDLQGFMLIQSGLLRVNDDGIHIGNMLGSLPPYSVLRVTSIRPKSLKPRSSNSHGIAEGVLDLFVS